MKMIGLLALVGIVAIESASGAVCDATTGASVKVRSITATTTTATITYTEGRTNGGRNFQFGIGTLGAVKKVATRNRSPHPETMTGLTPNSTYMYQFSGVWGGKTDKSLVKGTFKTDGTFSCGDGVATTGKIEGFVLNQSKDSIENVVVSIDEGGKIIATDTTDETGYYSFELKPGTNYKLIVAYAPFTAPGPATVPAITAGKTNKLADQTLTGAYQLSGMVKLTAGGTAANAAKVTVTHNTDASMKYEVSTNEEGHFSLGLKAGEYTVNAVLGAKALSAPAKATITTKSIQMTELVLSGTASIRILPKQGRFTVHGNSTYNAKGAREGFKASNQAQVIRFSK